uniref:Uncharacterized protein n=1 Tax=Arundo donax TaxID=35708 RepID=A0A0A8Z0M6_ARUDO
MWMVQFHETEEEFQLVQYAVIPTELFRRLQCKSSLA